MIRSMTGYSSHREQIGEALVSLEIKTLNHKILDLHFHGSRALSMLEVPVRETTQKALRRGRIEIYLRTTKPLIAEQTIKPNVSTARQYVEAAEALTEQLDLDGRLDVNTLIALNGVLDSEETETDPQECWKLIEPLFTRTLNDTIAMKRNEGARLASEVESLLDQIAAINEKIAAMRDRVIQEHREKLLERIKEWQDTTDLDENRVMQEVAFYCDRSDIQEETVRLKSHLDQFREILGENQPDTHYKAVGRRLDFLCQEMFR
ncbi:YicC family protein, partial [bacterium]|nr:YicC family protein [bacterium]